ncbi:hypothetical protein M513_05297 [Trichuris suis]|uniref:U1 small nuclear ribonucleoprotein C n=1 Tax=Trichuris suis TaxID=68888 RepID=A0A085M995_9BILA|nr:hypothetical protein M513_05297 [Trichuris suis]
MSRFECLLRNLAMVSAAKLIEDSCPEAGMVDDLDIKDMIERACLRAGDVWYVLSAKWYAAWSNFISPSISGDLECSRPGPIDNKDILKESSNSVELLDSLEESVDYVLIPKEAWQQLVLKYGIKENQKPVERKVIHVISSATHKGMLQVEVYLLVLFIHLQADPTVIKRVTLSQTSTFSNSFNMCFLELDLASSGDLESVIAKLFGLECEFRIFVRLEGNKLSQVSSFDREAQLHELCLIPQQHLVIDVPEKGEWHISTDAGDNQIFTLVEVRLLAMLRSLCYRSASTNSIFYMLGSPLRHALVYFPCFSDVWLSFLGYFFISMFCHFLRTRQSLNDWAGPSSSSSRLLSNSTRGLCGLNNLGNTCFMNSALQCLSNVPPLTKYFLSGKYKDEINNVNPLGMGGELAVAYADVIRNLWSGKAASFVPTKFKCTVGRFQPMFSGFQQQDAQELMAFLLDGLHEDLNRIKRKPYVEAKEMENEADEILAENAWRYYKMRNDSIITDLFNGLLKSTVICPECHKVSITFDPFGVLSLPLPEKPDRQIPVLFVPLDPNQPMVQHYIGVKRNHVVKDVVTSLSSLVNVPPKRIMCADIANGQVQVIQSHEALFRFLTARERVENKLIAYEVQEFSTNEPILTVCVYQVHQRWNGSYNYAANVPRSPHLFRVPKVFDFLSTLQRVVRHAFLRYVDPKFRAKYLQYWEEGKNGNIGDLDEGFNDDEHGDEDPFVLVQSSYTGDLLDADPAVPNSYETVIYVAAKWSPSFDPYLLNEKPVSRRVKMFYPLDMLIIPLEIVDTTADDSGRRMTRSSSKAIELADCLDLFTLKEKLGEQDAWYCPRCKKHQQATKKFDLWSLPEVLVIHLKRFSSCRNYRSKIETLISFPIRNMVMSKWVINPKSASFTYNLVSVCNHDGGLGAGHYTAFGLNCLQNKWYVFNDSLVRSTSEKDLVVRRCYFVLLSNSVLFVSDKYGRSMLLVRFLFSLFSLLLLGKLATHSEAAIVRGAKVGPNRVYHLNSDVGEISPTNGSAVYLPYTKLRWVISSQSKNKLYVTFDPSFGVQPAKFVACLDHVTIYDAAVFDLESERCAMHMHEPIGRYCGYKQPIVNGQLPSSIVVEFCSAPGEVGKRNIGFKLKWQTASPIVREFITLMIKMNRTVLLLTVPSNLRSLSLLSLPTTTTPTTEKPLSDQCGFVNKYAVPLIEIDENDEIGDYGQPVGSHEAKPNSWPWMGAIFGKGSFACAGSLLSEDIIVTAASCLHDWPVEAYVKLAAHDVGSTFMENEPLQRVCQVRHQIQHPMFEKLKESDPDEAKGWNIALIKFHCSAGPSPNITNVCLPKERKSLTSPVLAVVAGWGIDPSENGAEGIQSFPLHEAIVTENEKKQDCINPYSRRSYQNALCISSFENGNFYSSIDLGSPLLRYEDDRWILDGISSGETYPGEGMPTMFLDVDIVTFSGLLCAMPKYFCDYCDTFLTHDTPSVRKTHNSGRKHRENVRMYYQQWLEEQAQKLVDATARAFRESNVMRNPVGMMPPPGAMLIPGASMPLAMPPHPGMPIPGPPYMFPPAGMPPVAGLPPRPIVAMSEGLPLGAMPPIPPGQFPPRPAMAAPVPVAAPVQPEQAQE